MLITVQFCADVTVTVFRSSYLHICPHISMHLFPFPLIVTPIVHVHIALKIILTVILKVCISIQFT